MAPSVDVALLDSFFLGHAHHWFAYLPPPHCISSFFLHMLPIFSLTCLQAAGDSFLLLSRLYVYCKVSPLIFALKDSVTRFFASGFFSSISFPPAPGYPIRTVSNFFENSRRYSQLKVDHRCCWHRWQMRKIFNQKNFNNFVGTPLDSRVNTYICHRCRLYRWSTLSCEYLRKFSKKFETALMVYSGAWGKLIHEKNQRQKISWHCPFKGTGSPYGVVVLVTCTP